MQLEEFNALLGQNSYVRCGGKDGKIRIDSDIVDMDSALEHLESGGTIGWWIKPGYIVVDVDEGQKQTIEIIKDLEIKTLMCKTKRGIHLYFKCHKDHPQQVKMVMPFGLICDYRCANKGYVMLPFGMKGRAFNKQRKIIEMPMECTPIPHRKDSLLGLVEGDGRNTALFSHLMAYKNRGADDVQVRDMAHLINEYVFGEDIPVKELETVIRSTEKYDAEIVSDNPYVIFSAKGLPLAINGRAVCDYFVNSGEIFVVGGQCYRYAEGIYQVADSFVRNTIKDMVQYDRLITHARLMDCFRLVTDDTRLQKSASELNANPHYINFKNGVYDAINRKLLPHDSKHMQTIQIPHKLKKRIPKDEVMFFDFLDKANVVGEDRELLMKFMAYCMTTDFGLKTFLVLTGPTNTGKSVLIRLLTEIVGKRNSSSLSIHELNQRFYSTQLYGRLLNACADNSALPLSSIETLKKVTGGDQIMHEIKGNPNIFFFTPFAKLVFSFNQLPLQLEEKSDAFYKRLRIVPMLTALELNNSYVNKLCSSESIEALIPYLLKYLPLKDMRTTENSERIAENLRQDSDSLHAFIERCCKEDLGRFTAKEDLYFSYVRYCTETGREAHKKHVFFRHMRGTPYKEIRKTLPDGSRTVVYKDITLRKRRRK